MTGLTSRKLRLLQPEFFDRPADVVAPALIGCTLETVVDGEMTAGRIVEVEAYTGPDDPAAHGYQSRKTVRNAAMFGPAGTCYVYFIYGMHWCFNAVTGGEGFPAAVLIRALEPIRGVAAMKRRRGRDRETVLCAGPARLCQALGIDGSFNLLRLPNRQVSISQRTGAPKKIDRGPRIGIARAADWPLRFTERGSRWLSR